MIEDVKSCQFTVTAEDGVNLSVVEKTNSEHGQPKILLVHGSGCGWEYWDVPIRDYSIMKDLANHGSTVYAMECRGYGRSDRVDGRTVTAERLAADVVAIANEIRDNGEQVGLVGHSSSGAVVLTAAAKSPDVWSRMAILGAPYRVINPQFQVYASQMIEAAQSDGKDMVPNTHHLEIESRLNEPEDDVVDWYKEIITTRYPLIPAAVFADVIENPAIPLIPRIKVPTLLINGSNEYVINLEDSLNLLNDLGSNDKGGVVLPSSYHLPFLEKKGHRDLLNCLQFWFSPK
ncbi:MAG: hypothetical protein CMM74_12345 [Rhodospirillaceae bacterium]|nr:hypothetical protein [Rhodospirillaceae bacterium]|tara:strand:+ start:480 stop:1346 length:867 start_codon:yes stop_codon:yes gene_type:complete